MESAFQIALEKYLDLQKEAIVKYVQTVVEPLKVLEDPEKLMKRPFETWSLQDHINLQQVYGRPPNPYSKLVLRKKMEKLEQLKAETGG